MHFHTATTSTTQWSSGTHVRSGEVRNRRCSINWVRRVTRKWTESKRETIDLSPPRSATNPRPNKVMPRKVSPSHPLSFVWGRRNDRCRNRDWVQWIHTAIDWREEMPIILKAKMTEWAHWACWGHLPNIRRNVKSWATLNNTNYQSIFPVMSHHVNVHQPSYLHLNLSILPLPLPMLSSSMKKMICLPQAHLPPFISPPPSN